jgi:hypothetical protein
VADLEPVINASIGSDSVANVNGNVIVRAQSVINSANSSAADAGGGLIDVGVAHAKITAKPNITSLISSRAIITAAGSVTVDAEGLAAAPDQSSAPSFAQAQGGSGGGFDLAQPTAEVNATYTVFAGIFASLVSAGLNVNLETLSEPDLHAEADNGSGGVFAISSSEADVRFKNTNLTFVGANTQIVAHNDFTMEADSNFASDSGAFSPFSLNASATSESGGVFDGTTANATTDVNSDTEATVATNASITADHVDISAGISGSAARAKAKAIGGAVPGLGGSNATAIVDGNSTAFVTLDSGSIINGIHGVGIRADQNSFEVSVDKISTFDLLPSFGLANDNTNLTERVDGLAGATVIAGPPSLANPLALNVEANGHPIDDVSTDGSHQDSHTIAWSANAIIYQGVSPTLVVDSSGTVTNANNATVNLGNGLGFVGTGGISVDPIANAGGSKVQFNSPLGVVGLNSTVPTFEFRENFQQVTITNLSNLNLIINEIDVINRKLTQPQVELDGLFVGLHFNIQHDFTPTLVDIKNFGSGDIVLAGNPLSATHQITHSLIENPVGDTRILNTGGNIIAVGAFSNIRTNTMGNQFTPFLLGDFPHGIQATAGSIGANGVPIRIELVQSAPASPAPLLSLPFAGQEQFFAQAGGDINLSLTGVLRDPAASTKNFTVHLDQIEAGGNANVQLQSCLVETQVSGTLEGVKVSVPFSILPPPGSGTFFTQFLNTLQSEADPQTPLDAGVFGSSPSTIAGTYDFRLRDSSFTPTADPGLSAGNTITVTAAKSQPLDPIVNVIANTQFTLLGQRQLDVLTNGSITLQTTGNLPDGSITSTGGEVTLSSPQANIDAIAPNPGFNANVPAMNITLTAGNIAINTGFGDDTVNVESSLTAVTINLGTGTDVVNIAPDGQNLDSVKGNVTVNGASPLGFDTLNVDDQNGGGNYTLSSTSLSRGSDGVIFYGFIDSVNLFGGSSEPGQVLTSKYTINGTEPGSATKVDVGTGDATVDVNATARNSTLAILLGNILETSGDDTVNIAPAGHNLDSVAGNVTVTGGQGTDTLNVFDQNGRGSYNFSNTSLSRGSDGVISYNFVDFVNLSTLGGVTLNAQRSGNQLIVNDQGANPLAPPTITITATGFTRTQPNIPSMSLNITGFQNEVFNVSGTTNVQGTAAGVSTTIDVFGVLGFPSPAVFVGGLIDPNTGNGTLQAIQGPLTFLSQSSSPNAEPSVSLNDFNGPSAPNVTISASQITGLSPFPINVSAASAVVLDIGGPIGTAGSAGSKYTITGTPASVIMQLDAPGAADVVNVQAAAAGTPGAPTITAIACPKIIVGQVDPTTGRGTLQGIQGRVSIVNAFLAQFGGPNAGLPSADVQVNDANDPNPQTVTIGQGGITLQSVPTFLINQFPGNTGNSSIRNLTYLGGVSSAGSTYTIAGTPVTNSLTLSAPGPDLVTVQATSAGTTTTVNAGAGNERFIVRGTDRTLNAIQGALQLNGGTGVNFLEFDDRNSTTKHIYDFLGTLAAGALLRIPGGPQINWTNIGPQSNNPPGGVALDFPAPQFVGNAALGAAPAANIINVQGIAAGSSLTLNGSGGHVTVNVGSAAGSLKDIRSPLIITGQGTADVNVHDEGTRAAQVYTLGAGTLSRSGAGLISTSLPGTMVVDGGQGGNRFDVEGLAAGDPTTINAGRGGDLVRMRGGPIGAVLTLHGTGNTRLGYTGYTTDVYVNLGTGVATDVAAFRGIHSVTGGQGNSILVGGGGDDELIGGSGRNLLIGGGGHDHLVAGSDDDILVGGRTAYDHNRPALEAIMAEWGRTDLSYEARVHDLLHGSGGVPALNASTVFNDGAVDVLAGGKGRDLFFTSLSDSVLHRRHNEVMVRLD